MKDFPQILAVARAYPPELRGFFEIPGGKIEIGEKPEAALLREIREELGCRIVLGPALLSTDEDGSWPILAGRRMFVWIARPLEEPEVGSDHLELRWVDEKEAAGLPWLKPNVPIIRAAFETVKAARVGHSVNLA